MPTDARGQNAPETARLGRRLEAGLHWWPVLALRAIWRRLIFSFVFGALLIGGVAYLIFLTEQRAIVEEAYRLVGGVHQQTLNHLAAWRRDREAALLAIAQNPEHRRLLAARPAASGRQWRALADELSGLIGPRHRSVVVFGADGEVRLHLGDPLRDPAGFAALARKAMEAGTFLVGDTTVAARGVGDQIRILNMAPVRADGRTVGAIGVQIDPRYYVDPVVTAWPEMQSSGEVLLVRIAEQHIHALTRPKFTRAEAIPMQPLRADDVALQTGTHVRGKDYRGARVFAAVTPMPGTPWRLITKIDEAEVVATVRELALWVTAVAAALLGAGGSLLYAWWRKERADFATRQYAAELHQRALESHYDYLSRYANDVIVLSDEKDNIVEVNDRAVERYGYARDELLHMNARQLSAPQQTALDPLQYAELQRRGAIVFETVHRSRDGREIPVEVSARLIRADTRLYRQAIVRDITERKRAEERIRRLNDLYAALSQINASIIRSRSCDVLCEEICRIAVEYGHFDSAWVGMLDAERRNLKPVAQHGDPLPMDLLSSPELLRGGGPVAAALREGRVAFANDLARDLEPGAWHDRIAAAGIRAGAGVPLRVGGKVIGVIGIYSRQPDVFDAEMMRLLTELGDDVSFAMETFDRDEQRLRAERATRESEARYRHLFEHMSSGVLVFEPTTDGADFLIKDINSAVERIENLRREDLVGRRLLEAAPGLRAIGQVETMREVQQSGRPRHVAPLPLDRIDVPHRGWRELWFYALPTGEVVEVYDDVTARMEAVEALRASQERLSLVFKGVNDGYWDFNLESGELYYSRRFARMFGYEVEELGKSLEEIQALIHPDDLPGVRALVDEHLAGKTPQYQSEHRMRRKDGSYVWVLARGSVVRRDSEGRPLRMAGTHTDISEQKRYKEQLQLWATVFGSSGEAIFITDAERRIVSANRAFTEITGYTEAEVMGRDPSLLSSGEHDRPFYQNLWAAIESSGHWQGEVRDRRKNGEVFPMWTAITAVHDAQHRVRNYIAIASDISERKAAEERIRFLAHHDALTGLPNRELLVDRLKHALIHAERSHTRAAVLFVDLDRFKNVNDSLGHHVGDQLLKSVADRLRGCVRLEDTVSRQGGDEFLLLLSGLHHVADAAHVAQKVVEAISKPFAVGGAEIHMTPSIGIAIAPEDGTDGDTLIRNADAAMYYAKERGRNNFQFFTGELTRRALTRLSLENNLRGAVNREEFVLHYQPQLDIRTGELVGVEALVRWKREGRLVPPAEFISVAEDTGLIIPIGDWVLHEACRQQQVWKAQGLRDLSIAINLSPAQFRRRDMLPSLRRIVAETCTEPDRLEVELTESTIMDDAEGSIAILRGLKEMGISLAIDDFGTGYSSLNYLRRFPIDRLKVDQSFVRDLETDTADRAITEAIIALAKSLGLKVIAEGVERAGEIELLRESHCDELQGFYFSPPLPAEQFISWWRERGAGRDLPVSGADD